MQNKFADLEEIIKYRFKDTSLINTAFIHRSYTNEHKSHKYEDNQRMEYLGDAVLELVVSKYLYEKYPFYDEGKLTKRRIQIVCEANLSLIAKRIELYKYLFLGHGENIVKVKENDSILCDTLEALIAAIYIDAGFEKIYDILINVLKIEDSAVEVDEDYKSVLYEYAAKNKLNIVYKIMKETGPPHNKEYEVGLYIDDKFISSAIAHSKKNAEQKAASIALVSLRSNS